MRSCRRVIEAGSGPPATTSSSGSGTAAIPSRPWQSPGSAGWLRKRSPIRRSARPFTRLALATDDLQRSLVLGQYGQWDLVASVFTKVVERSIPTTIPRDSNTSGSNSCPSWKSGDLPGYRSAAGKLVSQYSKTSDPNSLNNVAWYCTYAPDAVTDLAVPVQMAEKALAGYPPDQKRLALNTLGAALYRAGRIDEAIARLDESVKASGGVGVPQDWAFLAMAHHKKGNDDEARRWLEKLRSHKADEKAGLSTDVVECRIFLKEAEALLREARLRAPLIRLRERPRVGLRRCPRAGFGASRRLSERHNVSRYESHLSADDANHVVLILWLAYKQAKKGPGDSDGEREGHSPQPLGMFPRRACSSCPILAGNASQYGLIVRSTYKEPGH